MKWSDVGSYVRKSFVDTINNHSSLRDALVELQATYTNRRYAPMFSGHGSRARFDGMDPTSPPFPLLTGREAVAVCLHWSSYACTIGGFGQVCDVRDGTRYADWGISGEQPAGRLRQVPGYEDAAALPYERREVLIARK